MATDGQSQVEFAISASDTTAAYPFRKKKKIWTTLLAWLLAIGAIGGLFAIVSLVGGGAADEAAEATSLTDAVADEDETDDNEDGDPIDEALGGTTPNQSAADNARVARPVAEPVAEPVDETPQFFTARQHELAWKKINSYLVRLEVRTPVDKRTITGTIVDSRGWVLTSWSALQDAGEVSVAVAAKQLAGQPAVRELVDLSRGIIATDPESDLALIAINRAQVIEIADIRLASTDNIVPSKRLLVARTPPPRHRSWLAECRISQRNTFDRLNSSLQESIHGAGLSHAADTDWIAFPPIPETNRSSEMAGSPMLESDGTVVAFSTGVFADDELIVVPAARARRLIDSVAGNPPQPRAFPRAADLARQLAVVDEQDPEQIEKQEKQNTWTDIISGLVKATETCRDTDWTAETADEYAALQKLSEHLFLAHQWIGNHLDQVDEPEYYDEQLQAALDEIGLSLEDDLEIEEFEAGKGNEFFSQLASTENPWFALYAEVESDLFNSPRIRGQNTVVFRILGTDEFVVSPIFEDARSFRSGRRFLLFGKLDSRGSLKTDQFGDQDRLELIDVFTFFELMRR